MIGGIWTVYTRELSNAWSESDSNVKWTEWFKDTIKVCKVYVNVEKVE